MRTYNLIMSTSTAIKPYFS